MTTRAELEGLLGMALEPRGPFQQDAQEINRLRLILADLIRALIAQQGEG